MHMTFRYGLALSLLLALLTACGGGNANLQADKMPEGGSFAGVYFSPQYGEMHLVQNGAAVHGKYKQDERSGEISGEADGNLLRFEWKEYKAMVSNRPQETIGHGYFHYLIDPSNGEHVLKGRWGLGDDESNGGEWNAYKSKSREPDPDSLGVGPTSGGESGGGDELDSDDESSSDDSSSEDDLF